MRVLLVLFFLLLWSGFAIGSVALVLYLGATAVRSARRQPAVDPVAAAHAPRWSLLEKLLAAGAVLGAAYGLILWVTFASHDASFLFAGGPALLFAALAGIAAVVMRRQATSTSTSESRSRPERCSSS